MHSVLWYLLLYSKMVKPNVRVEPSASTYVRGDFFPINLEKMLYAVIYSWTSWVNLTWI